MNIQFIIAKQTDFKTLTRQWTANKDWCRFYSNIFKRYNSFWVIHQVSIDFQFLLNLQIILYSI